MRNNTATLQLEEAAVILQCGPRLGTDCVPKEGRAFANLQMTSPASFLQRSWRL